MKTPTVKDYFRLQALYEISKKDNEALLTVIAELEERNEILAEELFRLLGDNTIILEESLQIEEFPN